jgi:hypothetical protein
VSDRGNANKNDTLVQHPFVRSQHARCDGYQSGNVMLGITRDRFGLVFLWTTRFVMF